MSRLNELRQRRAHLFDLCEGILSAASEDGLLSEEQETQYADLQNQIERINVAIGREEQLAESRRAQATTIVPGMPEQRRITVPPVRSTDPSAPFQSFGEFLTAVALAGMHNNQNYDTRLTWAAASGANEAVPAEGGFLVQKDISMQLMNMAHEMGEIWRRTNRLSLSTNSNGVKLPAIDETSRANGSRWGGVQVYWANEAETVAASRPKFRQIELELRKLVGIAYATEEVLRDSAVLGAIMSQAFTEELVFRAEDAFVNGVGTTQPLGWMNSGAVVTVPKEDQQANDTIVTQNILKMWSRLPLRSKRQAVWLINVDIEPQLHGLTLGTGAAAVMLYRPPGVDGPNANNPNGTLLGRPVIPVEYCAGVGDAGDLQLVDLSQYLTIDKDGVRSESSMHVRFIYDEMTFRFIFRVDGQPAWKQPVTPFKGVNTLSPFVILGAR